MCKAVGSWLIVDQVYHEFLHDSAGRGCFLGCFRLSLRPVSFCDSNQTTKIVPPDTLYWALFIKWTAITSSLPQLFCGLDRSTVHVHHCALISFMFVSTLQTPRMLTILFYSESLIVSQHPFTAHSCDRSIIVSFFERHSAYFLLIHWRTCTLQHPITITF